MGSTRDTNPLLVTLWLDPDQSRHIFRKVGDWFRIREKREREAMGAKPIHLFSMAISVERRGRWEII